MDSGDFAKVPFSDNASDDWLGQLQVDLPELFNFKDSTTDDFSSEELEDFTKGVDFNALESFLDVSSPETQHEAPGPMKTIKKEKESPLSRPSTKGIGGVSRDELLRFSSDDLEDYVKTIQATRALTTSETKEIKRQRRLIKNRESAQQSRKRKKDKVGDLEAQVAELAAVNNKQKSKLEEIQAEHVILQAEVKQLVSVIKDSPVLSSVLMNVTSWMVMYTLNEAIKKQNIQQTLIPPIIQQKMQQFPTLRAIC